MEKRNNKIGQPLVLVSFTIVFLFVLSFINLPKNLSDSHWFSQKQVDVFSEFRKDKPKPILVSLLIVKKDTPVFFKNTQPPEDETLITDYGTDSSYSLNLFYQKLDSAKQNHLKIRIAYFGDSFIEGDDITDEIRLRLQSLFGGTGIGFVPVQSAVSSLYTQIKLNGTGWTDYHFRDNPNKYPLGLSGHLFYSTNSAAVDFIPKFKTPTTDVKLYYGKMPANVVLNVVKNGKGEVVKTLGNNLINETIISSTSAVNSLSLNTSNENLPIYGVSFEDKEGVYLDNYSFRGNTSILTQQITNEVMQQMNNYLHYDLIIVHYGINAVEHEKQEFSWFESSMHKVIQNMKKGFGKVPILIVSTSDIGYKYDGKYSTEHGVPYMVATQKEIAKRHKVAFWNLYQSMGGENTITNWVEGDTVLANKDYTHVNSKGAKRVGDLFFNKLMLSKAYYQRTKLTKK